MGASKYQHSTFSVYTNLSYPICGIFLVLLDLSLIVTALSFITLGAGSLWYHKEKKRILVPFDYFGMYFVLISIMMYNATIGLGDPLIAIVFFMIVLTLTIPILDMGGFYPTAVLFLAMISSYALTEVKLIKVIALIGLFGISFFIRQLSHMGIIPKEKEGAAHGCWHLSTSLSFTYAAWISYESFEV